MKAEELRRLLEGTGTEILEAPYPICLVSKSEFRFPTEAEVEEHYDVSKWDEDQPDTFVSIMPSSRFFPRCSREEVRTVLGGKKLVVYSCDDVQGHSDFRLDGREDDQIWKVRVHEWTPS